MLQHLVDLFFTTLLYGVYLYKTHMKNMEQLHVLLLLQTEPEYANNIQPLIRPFPLKLKTDVNINLDLGIGT